jgi:dTDP-4-amino-4,6-dideoxygalactose transaminase
MFSRLIPFSVPSIENKFIKNLIKSIIRRDFYKGSDQVILEQEFSQYIGTKYAVCFSSARFALYQIYKSLNLKDKKVLFPSYTCIPALDALRWAGGIPRFLDIELESYSIIPDEELQNEQDIKGICLTHLYGLVGNIDWVLNFAKERGIPLQLERL